MTKCPALAALAALDARITEARSVVAHAATAATEARKASSHAHRLAVNAYWDAQRDSCDGLNRAAEHTAKVDAERQEALYKAIAHLAECEQVLCSLVGEYRATAHAMEDTLLAALGRKPRKRTR